MSTKQLHLLKPGDRVRSLYNGQTETVHMVVLHIFSDRQVVGAVEMTNKNIYQRNEMLHRYELAPT